MKVAVAQLAPEYDPTRNVEKTLDAMREAARRGAQLVVLPEMCLSPYQLEGEPLERWAQEIPGGISVQRWLRESKVLGIYVVAGLLERAGGDYYNTAAVLGPQGFLSCYRKAHLFGWERHRLAAGNRGFLSLEIQGTRLGVLICYDLRFMEAVRLLALEKVQLLCVPTAWTDIGKPQPLDRYGLCAAAHMSLGYAYANRLFVLCANRVGREKGVGYLGNSLVAGPTGETFAGPAGPEETTILIADVDPKQADDQHVGKENDVLADRRVDLYNIGLAERISVPD